MAGGNAIPTELGTKPIGTLLRQYAVPGIIAMTASSLYNMVDSIYIGHIPEVGSLSMAGLAVTFPLMNISTAFGTLVGVGAATMISVLLGQKNYKAAEKVLCNDVTLNLITGFVFTFVTLMWMDPILKFFGATEASLPFARDYMFYIAIGTAVTHLYFGLNAIVRSSGNPKLAMGLTLFTVISNAILDPIFIFVLGLGIRGAALATVLCQTMSLCYTLWYFLDQKKFLHLPRSRHIFRVDWRIAKDSLAIGLGPFLMNLASCIVVLFINQQLVKWGGDLALGAYGIVNRVGFLFVMIVMGFNQGMQPIAGYNYGARQFGRVKEVYIKTSMWATIVCTVGFLVAELFSMPVASIFTNDPALEEISAKGLRILFLVFPIVGFQMVTTNLFQCLGMVKKSVFLSLSRQLLFLLPCIYILPGIMQSEAGVWYSFPISDAIASVITAIFGWNLIVKLKKLKDGDDPSILGGQI
jgi:putative MATE family efflux protein